MSCGVGQRCGSEPALLWLWHRPEAVVAPIGPLAWELPYASGAALKNKTKPKKQKHLDFTPNVGFLSLHHTTSWEPTDLKNNFPKAIWSLCWQSAHSPSNTLFFTFSKVLPSLLNLIQCLWVFDYKFWWSHKEKPLDHLVRGLLTLGPKTHGLNPRDLWSWMSRTRPNRCAFFWVRKSVFLSYSTKSMNPHPNWTPIKVCFLKLEFAETEKWIDAKVKLSRVRAGTETSLRPSRYRVARALYAEHRLLQFSQVPLFWPKLFITRGIHWEYAELDTNQSCLRNKSSLCISQRPIRITALNFYQRENLGSKLLAPSHLGAKLGYVQ